jgi:hypothetical protein
MSYADYTRHRPDEPEPPEEPPPEAPHCHGCGCDVAEGVEYCSGVCEEESQ